MWSFSPDAVANLAREQVTVAVPPQPRAFTFDRCFGPGEDCAEVRSLLRRDRSRAIGKAAKYSYTC